MQKNLKWHVDGRKCGNLLRHPTDSPQWKKIDETFLEFGAKPRNLRLGLAIDGMNPYGNLCSKHNSWPVLLMIYNLSPLLCMNFCMSTYDFDVFILFVMFSVTSKKIHGNVDIMSCLG